MLILFITLLPILNSTTKQEVDPVTEAATEPRYPAVRSGGGLPCSLVLSGSQDSELASNSTAASCSQTHNSEQAAISTPACESLESTLLNHLGTDGFTLKLGSFGKFSVRHKPGIRRKIGFSGQTIQTLLRKVKFISLGLLRQRERVD